MRKAFIEIKVVVFNFSEFSLSDVVAIVASDDNGYRLSGFKLLRYLVKLFFLHSSLSWRLPQASHTKVLGYCFST